MPRYDFRCKRKHTTEETFSMAEVPPSIVCRCGRRAGRVFSPPAAIHFRGPGFYATDVNGKVRRKRRANPGDDLPIEFDGPAAAIADAI